MALSSEDLEEILDAFFQEARIVGLEEVVDLEAYTLREGEHIALLPPEEIILQAIKKVQSHLRMIDRNTLEESIMRLTNNISNAEAMRGVFLEMGPLTKGPDDSSYIPVQELAIASNDLILQLEQLAGDIVQSLDPDPDPGQTYGM